MRLPACILLAGLLSAVNGLSAEQRIELEGASIIGNRELPKVLYIVPWLEPGASRVSLGLQPSWERTPEPLDRDEFVRRIRYYQAMHPTNPDVVE